MIRAAVTSIALVVGIAGFSGTANGQENKPEAKKDTTRWVFETTPFLWASGIRGPIGFRSRNGQNHAVHADITFGELLKHLDGAFMIQAEGRKKRLGIGGEIIYIKVSDESPTPGPLFNDADVDVTVNIRELGPRFRIIKSDKVALDLLGAARWWKLKATVTLQRDTIPAFEIRDGISESWVDIVGGARLFVPINDRWLFQVRADAGGLGSTNTWQAFGAVAYRFSPSFNLRLGYRYLRVDFNGDEDRMIFFVRLNGLLLGGTIPFL